MDKYLNIPTIMVFVMIAAIMGAVVSCDRTPLPVKTADIVMIQPDNSKYRIAIDGYKIKYWWSDKVIIKLDPSVPEGKPRATFTLNRKRQPNAAFDITLSLNNAKEAKKYLGHGAEIDVDVGAGRDASVSVSKTEDNSSCFIGSITK